MLQCEKLEHPAINESFWLLGKTSLERIEVGRGFARTGGAGTSQKMQKPKGRLFHIT
jgi:hypothetical protein